MRQQFEHSAAITEKKSSPPLITLIRPSLLIDREAVQTVRGVPSLGVAYLSAALKNAGLTVKIIDGFIENMEQKIPFYQNEFFILGDSIDEMVSKIDEQSVFIGVSCMFSSEWILHRRLIKAIKEKFPNIPIIAGGEHITSDPDYVFTSCPGVDICVLGEGEETILELYYAIVEGKDLNSVKGICFRNDLKVKKTLPRSRIKDLDEIAWPDWSNYPLIGYLEHKLSLQEPTMRSIPMLGSRGCPYKCTFCTNLNMWGIQWISRDPQDIVNEIKFYRDKYSVNYIEFWDLTFLINRKWIHEFCDILIKEDLKIHYGLPSGTRSEVLDEELLTKLFKSGLKRINFSPESGSEHVLNIIQKRANLTKFLKVMNLASQSGLYVTSNIVLGFPGERKQDVILSFKYIVQMAKAGIHDLYLLPYAPYPGSKIFNDLVEQGLIDNKNEEFDHFLAKSHYIKIKGIKSYSDSLSGFSINVLFLAGRLFFYLIQFLFRPRRLLQLFKNVSSNQPQTYFERLILGLWKNFIMRK